MNHVRVNRNRYGKPEQPWLVTCTLCAGEPDAGIWPFIMAFGKPGGVKGWAATWQQAQEYATKHAVEHEKTRCPTCLHVPAEKLADERTSTV